MRITLTILLLTLGLPVTAAEFSPAVPMPSVPLDDGKEINRIALGSCFHPSLSGEVFNQIAATKPDVFLFLGDNVYAIDESEDPALMSLRSAYADLAKVESFTKLREKVPVLPIWDDHDYGKNDAGGDWSGRYFSESLYEYVWAIDSADPRASRQGVYFERTVGTRDHKVQFILLDTRFFRSPLTPNPNPEAGRYIPSIDPDQSLLGAEQWAWFERQLEKPANLRIIVSTIQLIAEGHAWESWRMLHWERLRFYELLRSTKANDVVVVSGDRHAAYLYKLESETDYPLYELTTSSLNVPLTRSVKDPQIEPGPFRIGDPYFESNYGLIDIDWQKREVALKLLDENSKLISEQIVHLGNPE